MECPYSKYNSEKGYHECILTSENVEDYVMCEFEYDECEDYKSARRPISPANISVSFFQTSIFGEEIKLK